MKIRTWGDLQAFAVRVALPVTAEVVVTTGYGAEETDVEARTDEGTTIRCPRPGCTHTHQSIRLVLSTDI